MATLERVHSISFGRVGAFFGIFLGIILGLVAMVFGVVTHHSNPFFILLLFLVGLLAGVVCGAIYGLATSWIYNFSAGIVGGVKLGISKRGNKGNVSMLNTIDPLSYGRIEAVSTAVIVIIAAFIFLLVNSVFNIVVFSEIFMIGLAILAVVFGAVVGFIGGWLNGHFYNFAVGKIGAIQISIAKGNGSFDNILKYVDYMSYAKVSAFLIALWSIINLVVRLFIFAAFGALFGAAAVGLGVGFGIISVFFAIVSGFVMSILIAIVYNVAAGRLGGVQFKLG